MFDQRGSAGGNALAAGTVLVALIEALVDNGTISDADVHALLRIADAAIKPMSNTPNGDDAKRVIDAMVKRFNS